MRLKKLLLLLPLFTLFAWGNARAADEPVTSEYRLEYQIDGKKVVTLVHFFSESPFDNPNIVEQVKNTPLDHVAFLSESEALGRMPGAADPLAELRGKIETQTNTPVVEVKQKKGFFKRLAQSWKLSFQDPARVPGPADYRYGLVSTIGDSATFAAMVFTSADIPIENAIGLVVAQTMLSYVNNVWNNSINHFLTSSINRLGRTVSTGVTVFRNLVYEHITSEIFKAIQSPSSLLTAASQTSILMNTLMVGTGDIILSNAVYRAFRADKVKLARANFYVSLTSGLLGSLDLMQHHLMPVLLKVGAYDFRLSGAILIGYYATMLIAVKASPSGFYRQIERLDNGLQRVGTWFKGLVSSCDEVMSGEPPTEEL